MRALTSIVALALLAAACSEEATVPLDLEGRSVTVAVENDYPPFNFVSRNESGPQGWDYDAWNEICNRLNCEVQFVEAEWPDLITETGDGDYDAAADGIEISADRAEVVDFSIPYMSIDDKLLVRVDEARFDNPEAFVAGGYRLGTPVGSMNHRFAVSLLGEDRIEALDSVSHAVAALVDGDVDAVIVDDIAGLGYYGDHQDEVRLLAAPLRTDFLAFIFPKGSELVAPVDAAMTAMKEDGSLGALIATWFGEGRPTS